MELADLPLGRHQGSCIYNQIDYARLICGFRGKVSCCCVAPVDTVIGQNQAAAGVAKEQNNASLDLVKRKFTEISQHLDE